MSAKEKNAANQQTTMPETQVSTTKRHDDRQGVSSRGDSHDSSPRLPHEHDESFDSQKSGPRDDIRQAHADIESGQIDTDRRGMPGVEEVHRDDHDATQKALPESARKPSSTPKD
ncbi:hypothetical protein [uncultured Oxalicibacterium sp.]|uniref:hypothetical protein n=1 Tax=uncultured Oxalicibacterium sp. TaxID=1168540 RepID=UPI0025FA2095|nr:hypothetical protein [uncultured Oxalicibacterium sp.]